MTIDKMTTINILKILDMTMLYSDKLEVDMEHYLNTQTLLLRMDNVHMHTITEWLASSRELGCH